MVDVNSEPKRGKAELRESRAYLVALGNFMLRFSDLEVLLNGAVWKFSGLMHRKSIHQAILGRLPVEQSTDKLKRLIRAKAIKDETAEDMRYMLTQISHIQRIRNDMLHLGYSAIESDVFVYDNALFAIDENAKVNYRVSAAILNDMSTDVLRICRELYALVKEPPDRQRMFWLMYDRVQGYAWRYKPLSQ